MSTRLWVRFTLPDSYRADWGLIGEKNKHFKEHEITFVGGIKRDFVPFAIEYKDGLPQKIWENGHTDQRESTIPRPADVPLDKISP